ncbi:MAG: DUF433 domain-containing protein [Dehalococcoidia bacterium]
MAVLAQTHIVATPDTMSGAPRIAGHRIRVQDIVFWHLKQGRGIGQIVDEYRLTPAEVHSALAYYYDHVDEIEAAFEADRNAAQEMAAGSPSLLTPERIAAFRQSLNG